MQIKYRIIHVMSRYGSNHSLLPKQILYNDSDYATEYQAIEALENMIKLHPTSEFTIIKVYTK